LTWRIRQVPESEILKAADDEIVAELAHAAGDNDDGGGDKDDGGAKVSEEA
jgi:hypothetical protein